MTTAAMIHLRGQLTGGVNVDGRHELTFRLTNAPGLHSPQPGNETDRTAELILPAAVAQDMALRSGQSFTLTITPDD